jgi:hypothetical protein
MAGKKDPRDDRPNPKHRAHDAACLPVPPFTALMANDQARLRSAPRPPGEFCSQKNPAALDYGHLTAAKAAELAASAGAKQLTASEP